jgi:hypothetical protein
MFLRCLIKNQALFSELLNRPAAQKSRNPVRCLVFRFF